MLYSLPNFEYFEHTNFHIKTLKQVASRETIPLNHEIEFSGQLTPGLGSNGFDPSQEEVTISLDGQEGETLPAGSFAAVGSGWQYYRPDKATGIYYFKITPGGEFFLKAKGISNLPFNIPSYFTFGLEIGNDLFNSSSASSIGTKPRSMVELYPNKLIYSTGEGAQVEVVPNHLPSKEGGRSIGWN